MADLIITAPVKGWAASLDEVPDPVFGDRMMGDGVAIHPIGSTVHAPCDGVVATLHAARHAVTVRSAEGAEILIHVGLETVALGGDGFRALVAEGDTVSRGDPLIEFDMDGVAQLAAALVTPVVVVNSEAFRIERRTTDKLVGVGEALMTLSPIEMVTVSLSGQKVMTNVVVPLVHGIHARPAARIGEAARAFEADVEIVHGERRANVRSAVALMGLGLKLGDEISIEAQGPDAHAALDAVVALIESGMGEAASLAAPAPARTPVAAVEIPAGAIGGITASPGLAIGAAAWLRAEALDIPNDAEDPAVEAASLGAALDKVRAGLAASAAQGSEAQRHILEAHLAFLDDEDLLNTAHAHIANGRSAAHGWHTALSEQAGLLRRSGDARFAERAGDLDDLDRQVQLALAGRDPEARSFAPGTVLLADDLLPSQMIGLDVAGIALIGGGPTAHVAILAAARGIPMLVAVGTKLEGVAEGATLVLDADAALLHVDPATEALAQHRQRFAKQTERRAAALAAAHDACRTADGTRIELFANLGSLDDAVLAAANGAEGSGLLRTEFLFMDRAAPPSEDEQRAAYQAMSDALGGKPIIVRLLDIGGDKPAPWLPMAAEKNPMLGQRGIRVGLAHPELLESQVRAILRVQGDCRIMVPMVASLSELRAVRAVVDRAAADLGVRPAPLGVMIETPAAAMIADLIAVEADFLSIGTNDLTQYTLAMDRENSAVASGVDACHPAVLRLIAMTCEGAGGRKRIVGVCGGLAADPPGIPLLIGLGVTELSATPAYVPEAKALVRQLDLTACRALAAKALGLDSAAEIRALARKFIEELN